MKKEAYIGGIGKYLPPSVLSTERFLEVDKEIRVLYDQPDMMIKISRELAKQTRILNRYTVTPFYLPENERPKDVEDIFTSTDFAPPYRKRIKSWMDAAIKMSVEAAKAALADWGKSKDEITHIISVSSTGWYSPGIACALVDELGLSLDCEKLDLYFAGCASGVAAMRIARDFIRSGNAKAVLIVAAETPSIHYDPINVDHYTMTANALFGDGAGAAVIAPEGKWQFEKTGSITVPDSKELLYFGADVKAPSGNGSQMCINSKTGSRVAEFFRNERGKLLLKEILDHSGTPPGLAVHIGGPRNLQLGDVLAENGWPEGTLDQSFKTLQENGNTIGAAIFLVLLDAFAAADHDRLIVFGFGPGLTIEWGLIKKTS